MRGSGRMIYAKCFLTGLAALVVAGLLAIVVLFAGAEMSSGDGVGVVVGPVWPVLAVSLLAFASGFFWQYRRTR
jgi:hypothetical protein